MRSHAGNAARSAPVSSSKGVATSYYVAGKKANAGATLPLGATVVYACTAKVRMDTRAIRGAARRS